MAELIKTLEIAGDNYALGWQLGRASAEFMHNQLVACPEWQTVQQPGNDGVLRAMEQIARRDYPQYVHEIEGLAAGAEMDFQQVFAWQCEYELGKIPPAGAASVAGVPSAAAEGCTTLAAPTPEGVLVAHNEDAMALYDGHCLWVQVHPDDGLAYTGFHYPGRICGNCFFVNAAGIVHSTNHIAARRAPGGLPRQIIVRAIVDAASPEDIIALLQRTDRASGCHHTVAQVGTGQALSIEAPAAGCSVKQLRAPYAHANHLIRDEFAQLEQMISPSSAARQERADALVAALPETVTMPDLVEILCDQKDGELSIYRPVAENRGATATVAAATFEVTGNSVQWAVYGDPRNPPLYRGTEVIG